MDGLTLCKKIRQTSTVPIIMITAKSEDEDVIMGIDVGADDYIVKPFSPRQVVAKIKALIRRLDIALNDDKLVVIDNLVINMDEYIVKIADEVIPLTKKEIEILYLIAKHPSRIYSREILLDTLWGDDYFGDVRTVDTHIKRIRAKLHLNNNKYSWDIKTVWGVGYKFERESN
jgi:DNA-binding response OmpR family regulator